MCAFYECLFTHDTYPLIIRWTCYLQVVFFVGYLTTLSVAKLHSVEWEECRWMMKWIWKEAYSGLIDVRHWDFPRSVRKTMKSFSRDCWSSGRDSSAFHIGVDSITAVPICLMTDAINYSACNTYTASISDDFLCIIPSSSPPPASLAASLLSKNRCHPTNRIL
jgi:hypothetical protein